MRLDLAYWGQSHLTSVPTGFHLHWQPNLDREPVAFDAPLLNPLRFREAISCLHDVVISDLRYQPRDKTAYEAWKRQQQMGEHRHRKAEYERLKKEFMERKETPITPELEREYRHYHHLYWKARRRYERYLWETDREIWRLLMPYDPVITVADDALFMECFSADESSYGCLSVNRDQGFGRSDQIRLGTTNVDYSWELYHHFQRLRTYRETRFHVDPEGFEVRTEGREEYREEKIDLPESWLRGFMQLQAAMTMPTRRVTLSREAVYSVLAWLRRNRARRSPRALRFELLPGEAPRIVIEPWEIPIVSHGTTYDGPSGEPIRIWGRRRLLVLSRILPLLERLEVHLVGTGLPSFWVARLGDMTLTLGLSGWTANDWTRGAALDLLAPPAVSVPQWQQQVAEHLRVARSLSFREVESKLGQGPAVAATVLNRLARQGQVIYDLSEALYRWRQVLPMALSEGGLEPVDAQMAAANELMRKRQAQVISQDDAPDGGKFLRGKIGDLKCELLMDGDGRIRRGSCLCAHHRRSGIRKGPCAHLLALRNVVWQQVEAGEQSANAWYEKLVAFSNN